MENKLVHEIELYPPETFKTLLGHEVNRSQRYGDSLSLIDLVVEAHPSDAQAQHKAEVFTINALNIHLRETDIPCKNGNEFLILMPATPSQGARIACERLKKLMTMEPHVYDTVSFKISTYIGMATLPNDRSVSSDGLAQHASQALRYAQSNRREHVVSFSELKNKGV